MSSLHNLRLIAELLEEAEKLAQLDRRPRIEEPISRALDSTFDDLRVVELREYVASMRVAGREITNPKTLYRCKLHGVAV